jgi:hypothetical protein
VLVRASKISYNNPIYIDHDNAEGKKSLTGLKSHSKKKKLSIANLEQNMSMSNGLNMKSGNEPFGNSSLEMAPNATINGKSEFKRKIRPMSAPKYQTAHS